MNDTLRNDELQQLAVTAEECKRAFYREKSRRTGRRYKADNRTESQSVWTAIAKVVLSLKATPEDYMLAQFRYAKCTVFANTLAGPTAKKRYRMLQNTTMNIQTDGTVDDNMPVDAQSTPGNAELIGILEHTMSTLANGARTGNIIAPSAVTYILDHFWLFDAVGVMLLSGGVVVAYNKMFLREAQTRLHESPHIVRAAREAGFDPDSIMNQQDEERKVTV